MTFESEGLLIVAIYTWLPPASYVVLSDNSGLNLEYWKYTVFHTFLLSALPTCIYKFSWNLKFHVGFFNTFLLEKYYTKIAF